MPGARDKVQGRTAKPATKQAAKKATKKATKSGMGASRAARTKTVAQPPQGKNSRGPVKGARPAKGNARKTVKAVKASKAGTEPASRPAAAKGRPGPAGKPRTKGPPSRKRAPLAKGAAATSGRSAAKGGKTSTSALIGHRSNGSSSVHSGDPARVVQIKALDPLVACGPHTSVKHLFRLREQVDGTRTVHLVFFDKHGWYCEHGRSCHAVTLVQRAFPHLTT